jgi:hypothetical protein
MADPEIRCWFEVESRHPDPSTITEALGISPTESWPGGKRPLMRRPPPDTARWELESPLSNDSVDLDEIARAVLDLLPPELPSVAERDGWTTMLRYTVFMRDRTPAIFFEPATLARLVRLGAAIDIDTYVGQAGDRDGQDEPMSASEPK